MAKFYKKRENHTAAGRRRDSYGQKTFGYNSKRAFAAIAVTALVFTLFPAQSQAQVEKPTDTTNETIYYLKDYNGRLPFFQKAVKVRLK